MAAGTLLVPRLHRPLEIRSERAGHPSTAKVVTLPRDIHEQAVQQVDRDKALYLDNLLLALNTYGKPNAQNANYLQDFDVLYATLSRLMQDESGNVANLATAIMNVLALMQLTSDIPPVSDSESIKAALKNVIEHGENDTARGQAIDAWVLMYPPDDGMVSTLENILRGDMDRFPESHAAAFRAYGVYKRRYGYQLPDSTVSVAKNLLEHPSQDVRVKAEFALAEMGGTSVLPILITQLEQAGDSSESRMLTALILSLDNSQDTIDRLNRITDNLHGPEDDRIAN